MVGRDFLRDPRGPFNPGDTITISSQSEEATFALPPLDLRLCIIALQRFLLCAEPRQAETSWWLRSAQTNTNLGQWVEIREAGLKPFYTFSDGVVGRSSPTRPAGVAPKDIVVITVPAPPPTALKQYFQSLVEALPDNDSWKSRLLRWERQLNAMYSPQFLPEVASQHYAMIRGALSDGRDVVGRLNAHCAYIYEQYTEFNLDGFSIAYALLITRLMAAIYPLQPTGMLDQSFEQFARAKNIGSLLATVLALPLSRQQLLATMKQVGSELQREGESLKATARQASSVGQFYGNIFASIPYFLSAYQIFRFLGSEEGGADSYALGEARLCDEQATVALLAMQIQFSDSMTHREALSRREEVRIRRAKSGNVEAEDLVAQYIEMEMLYPAFTRRFLLGETFEFPHRASAA